jgi:hypothetical protein
MESATGLVISEETKKIYASSAVNLTCAWGWFGAVRHNSRLLPFDLVRATLSLCESFKNKEFSSIAEYADTIATGIHCGHLVTYQGRFPIEAYAGEVFAGLFVVGFFDARPQTAQIEFRQKGGRILRPILADVVTDQCGMTIASGSEAVYRALETNRPCTPPSTLADGRKMAHKYIWTCKYNNKTCDECRGIGGRIHIAAITPKGFEWCIPPINPES